METWFIIIVSLSLSLLANAFLDLLLVKSHTSAQSRDHLPPGTTISTFAWLCRYSSAHGPLPLAKHLRSKLGPIFTIYVGSRPTIWISDPFLVHQALIKNGAYLADRLPARPTHSIFNSHQHTVSSATYGPVWQSLRRNLASNFLNPARLSSFSRDRKWALDILIHRFKTKSKSGSPIQVREHFLHANFCLQCVMCFGLFLNEAQVRDVQSINRRVLLGLPRFSILNVWPKLTKILFAGWWAEIHNLRKELDNVFLHLIKLRKKYNDEHKKNNEFGMKGVQYCYVDSLLELNVPSEDGGLRKLEYVEMVSLCNEFINASTDLPTTELEWTMANLMRYPQVQAKLLDEIKQVTGPNQVEIREEDLVRMPYLKAVILEVLRLHPPAQLIVPHQVGEDIELGGYLVPKNASINVLVGEIGRDPNIWEDPMEFKPERFLETSSVIHDGKVEVSFDMAGRREIKMMPFGVGRRMCPGNVLARLNLEYLVANLVWHFEWKAVDGDYVDLSEKEVFTIMMKNPLKAQISPRRTSN